MKRWVFHWQPAEPRQEAPPTAAAIAAIACRDHTQAFRRRAPCHIMSFHLRAVTKTEFISLICWKKGDDILPSFYRDYI